MPVLDSYYGLLYFHVMISEMYSCYDFHMICNSDSICLDIRWHEIKVYRWGFPCLDYSFDVLISWDRDLSIYNQSCIQLYLGFPVSWWFCCTRLHIYFICVLTLLSSVLDTRTHPGSPPGIVSYSPGEFHWLPWILMSRSWSPERMDFPRYCSEWRSGSVDLQTTVQSHILPDPLCASRVSS